MTPTFSCFVQPIDDGPPGPVPKPGRAVLSAAAQAKAKDVLPYIQAAQKAGATTLAQVAQALEARGVRTPRGSTQWVPAQVARILKAA